MKREKYSLLWENCKREIKVHRGNKDMLYRELRRHSTKEGIVIRFVSVYAGIQLLYQTMVDHFGEECVFRALDNKGRRCILVKLKIEE